MYITNSVSACEMLCGGKRVNERGVREKGTDQVLKFFFLVDDD